MDVKYGWAPFKMSPLEREMVPKIAPYFLDVRYDISIGPHTYQGQSKFVSKHESHIHAMFEDHPLTL